MNLLWLLKDHIPTLLSGRTRLQKLHRLSHHHTSNQTYLRTKKEKKKKGILFFSSFVALREKFNYNLGCMLALRRKKSRRQMNIQSK